MKNESADNIGATAIGVEGPTDTSVAIAAEPDAAPRTVDLKVVTLLGTVVDFKALSRTTSAGAVARATVARLNLPQDLPYGLRDETKAEYIDDEIPIGELTSGAEQLRLVPKAHLG